jgi:arylsulfatase A-like enzyme
MLPIRSALARRATIPPMTNLIVIMLDSFRQDHVGVYHQGRAPFPGIEPCRTPNIDRFASHALIFENAYPEAFPTIPVRTALMTGQRTLPYRPWQPLEPSDMPVAEILRRHGYVNGLISDTYHYRAPGMNFHRGFHAYRWIRGQEYDPYESGPTQRRIEEYVNENYPPIWRTRIAQFLANTDAFARREDWFAPQVIDEACRWLERNRSHQRIFLWIDSFDPHEPWDPPREFDHYTDPAYRGRRLIMPMGGLASSWANDDEIQHIRGLYAGEAESVDFALGQLFETLERLGYYDDSIILLLADHGHPLADHGKFLKGADRLYNELLKVPFLLHLPGGRRGGTRIEAMVQYHDVLPTLFDLMGLAGETHDLHGRSFRAVVEGEVEHHRRVCITGYHAGVDRAIRALDPDGEERQWSLILRPEGEPDELYDLTADPREQHNLIDERHDLAARLAGRFGPTYFRARGQQRIVSVIKGVQGAYEVASGAVE